MKRLPLIAFFIIGTLVLGHVRDARAVVLPDPEIYSITYGDFYSYSLPVLAYLYSQETGTPETNPQNPYYVQSGPGQIKDSVVIATGVKGTDAYTNPAGMENAYETPNFASSDTSVAGTFTTADAADPANGTGLITDSLTTWDANISSMVSYLDGSMPVFYFNNNQIKGSDAEFEDL